MNDLKFKIETEKNNKIVSDGVLNLSEQHEIIDLSTENNDDKKKIYETVYRTIELGGGIRFRIMTSENGTFVDIRKYHIDHYTTRGIRIPIRRFLRGSEQVRLDFGKMIKNIDN